jgi:hypothetical protein
MAPAAPISTGNGTIRLEPTFLDTTCDETTSRPAPLGFGRCGDPLDIERESCRCVWLSGMSGPRSVPARRRLRRPRPEGREAGRSAGAGAD